MSMKKITKTKFTKLIFGIFFALVNLFNITTPVPTTYAEPDTTVEATTEETVETAETAEEEGKSALEIVRQRLAEEEAAKEEAEKAAEEERKKNTEVSVDQICVDGFDTISWLLCPKGRKGSDAVDWIYEKIETVLAISPVTNESNTAIMRVWEVARGITNIIFVIFLLIVVFSQVTGVGISNYGIKQALPKLIIAALAVNLSFYLCGMAVDLSNIIGASTRNLFLGIESSIAGVEPETYNLSALATSYGDYWDAVAGGSALMIGGVEVLVEGGKAYAAGVEHVLYEVQRVLLAAGTAVQLIDHHAAHQAGLYVRDHLLHFS